MNTSDIYRAFYMLELRMQTPPLTHEEVSFYAELVSLALSSGRVIQGEWEARATMKHLITHTPAHSRIGVYRSINALGGADFTVNSRLPYVEHVDSEEDLSFICSYSRGENREVLIGISDTMMELLIRVQAVLTSRQRITADQEDIVIDDLFANLQKT